MSFSSIITDHQTALIVGGIASSAQIFFYCIFAYVLPDGIWRRDPGYLAHQVVCLPLMVFMSVVGVIGWWCPNEAAIEVSATFDGRVFGHNDMGELLSQTALGLALFWDTPCSLLIKSLRKADSLAHHSGMAVLSYFCCSPLYSYYTPVVFGIIEISSIPLTISEVFHPDYFPEFGTWYPALGAFNENVLRPAFAVSFLLLRGIYLVYIGVVGTTPDTLAVIQKSSSTSAAAGMYGMLAGGWFLLLLQAYWSTLILKAVVKALRKAPEEDRSSESQEPLLSS